MTFFFDLKTHRDIDYIINDDFCDLNNREALRDYIQDFYEAAQDGTSNHPYTVNLLDKKILTPDYNGRLGLGLSADIVCDAIEKIVGSADAERVFNTFFYE